MFTVSLAAYATPCMYTLTLAPAELALQSLNAPFQQHSAP